MSDKQYQELSATIHRFSQIYTTLANMYGKLVEEAAKDKKEDINER